MLAQGRKQNGKIEGTGREWFVCVHVSRRKILCLSSHLKKKNGVAMPVGIWQENGKYVALTNQLEIS